MNFDWLAPHYRWMEIVLAGRKLQRCRTAFLNRPVVPANILMVGEGNGRCLVECLRRFPDAAITMVDASEGMLVSARRRLNRCGFDLERIRFVHADARTWEPPAGVFELLVSHFFLDCFPADQLGGVIANLARGAAVSAEWLVADFQIPNRGWRRGRAALIHAAMYAFFRIVTRLEARRLTPPDPFLESSGFELKERRTSEWGLLRSDLWAR